MNYFEMRLFKPEDENDVIALWEVCKLIAPQNNPQKDILRKAQLGSDFFLVGSINNQLIASCMGGYDGHRGCINYLAVNPQYQRKGYASEILTAVEQRLKSIGCPKVNLLVRNSNRHVLDFYDSIGYSDNQCISLGKRLISDEN